MGTNSYTSSEQRTARRLGSGKGCALRSCRPGVLGALAVLLCVWLATAAGCTLEERVIRTTFGDIQQDFADDPRASVDGGFRTNKGTASREDDVAATPAPAGDWAILLRTFEGRGHARQADRFVRHLRQEANMTDLWTSTHEQQTYVYRGEFYNPEGFNAEDALRQTRMARLDQGRPFQDVAIARIVRAAVADAAGGVAANRAEMDLLGHAGKDLYSLQVGVYDEDFGKDFREAAEEFARFLRAAGDQAFYCHKPHNSMVTVGLFTHDQAFEAQRIGDVTQDAYAPAIRQLQGKHPNNLLNGRTIVVTEKGRPAGNQESFLVRF